MADARPFPSPPSRGRRRRSAAPWLGLAALLVCSSGATGREPPAQGGLTPVELRCDGAVDPLGVDAAPPRLSWKLRGEAGRGLRQRAWQVLVASSLDRVTSQQGDLWDSGRVESEEQLHVPYAGRALHSAEQVFWKVRVWDGEDRPSPWSAAATWTMGVLEPDGWPARWITDPGLWRVWR